MANQNILDLLNLITEVAGEKINEPLRSKILSEINMLKETIVENRSPKIIVIGRRGAGKSSLINAIFQQQVAKVGSVVSETGAAEWHDFTSLKGTLRILDTRGIGDRTKPESANFENSIDEIKHAIDKERPDAILFLCKAKEVDAHISEDINNLVAIKDYVNKKHNFNLPVAAVVTQIDELDPKRIEPPYDNEIKQKNINKATDSINEAMKSRDIDLLRIIPVSTYVEFDKGVKSYDNYYNVEILVEYLMDVLPKSAQLQMARISSIKEVQKKFANVLINSTATICAAIAATPIPVADLIPITGAQITMIIGIGYLSGRDLSKDSAREFLVAAGINTGVGFVLREGARALIKFAFPGGGSAVSAVVAAGSTWGIGKMAVAYFIEEKAMSEVKEIYKKSKKDMEDEFEKSYKK